MTITASANLTASSTPAELQQFVTDFCAAADGGADNEKVYCNFYLPDGVVEIGGLTFKSRDQLYAHRVKGWDTTTVRCKHSDLIVFQNPAKPDEYMAHGKFSRWLKDGLSEEDVMWAARTVLGTDADGSRKIKFYKVYRAG